MASFHCARPDAALLDFSETSLFEIEREMAETFPLISRNAVLCDVRNAARVTQAFAAQRFIDLVFHAVGPENTS